MSKISFKKLNSAGYLKNRKARPVIIALVLTLAFMVFVTANLFAGTSYEPEDTVSELNYERSQVYVDGTGYVLDSYTKKQHQDEEEQRSIIQQEEQPEITQPETPQQTSPTIRTYPRTYPGTYYPRRTTPPRQNPRPQKRPEKKKEKEKTSEYDKKKEELSVKPVIKISGVKKGETVKSDVKKFKVSAVSYDGDDITGSDLTVKMNGVTLTSSGRTYKGNVQDGDNKIVVKAVDSEGNTATKTIKFKGVTGESPEVTGQLDVEITADVLGLGSIADASAVDIYDSEQLSDVVKRFFSKETSIKAVESGAGYYEIGRIKKDGILDDIPDDILEELEKKGITVPDDRNSLGTDDFGPGSGWMYKVNGSESARYMSAVDPEDGATIEIYYVIPGLD